jgi:hypothetical protein
VSVHLLTILYANATFKVWMCNNLLDTCNKKLFFLLNCWFLSSFEWELLCVVRTVRKCCVRPWMLAMYLLILRSENTKTQRVIDTKIFNICITHFLLYFYLFFFMYFNIKDKCGFPRVRTKRYNWICCLLRCIGTVHGR